MLTTTSTHTHTHTHTQTHMDKITDRYFPLWRGGGHVSLAQSLAPSKSTLQRYLRRLMGLCFHGNNRGATFGGVLWRSYESVMWPQGRNLIGRFGTIGFTWQNIRGRWELKGRRRNVVLCVCVCVCVLHVNQYNVWELIENIDPYNNTMHWFTVNVGIQFTCIYTCILHVHLYINNAHCKCTGTMYTYTAFIYSYRHALTVWTYMYMHMHVLYVVTHRYSLLCRGRCCEELPCEVCWQCHRWRGNLWGCA